MKFGRNPHPKETRACVRLDHFLDEAALPTPPESFDFSTTSRAAHLMMANDRLGDCVPVGGNKVLGVWTANAGEEVIATDAQVIHDYEKIGGYVPGRPGTDNGCNEQDALDYWQRTGFFNGDKIEAWLKVDPTNIGLAVKILWTFEHLFYGSSMPNAWTNVNGDDFIWDAGRGNPMNGHCFPAFGRKPGYFRVATWSKMGWLTDAAHARNIDEAYVMLNDSMVSKIKGTAPNAIDWPALVTYWNSLGGTMPNPPQPIPTDWMTL